MYTSSLYFLGYLSGALVYALLMAIDIGFATETIIAVVMIPVLQNLSCYLTKF